ncbi:hypothetical protein D3C78_1759260 [compost metagenome]
MYTKGVSGSLLSMNSSINSVRLCRLLILSFWPLDSSLGAGRKTFSTLTPLPQPSHRKNHKKNYYRSELGMQLY